MRMQRLKKWVWTVVFVALSLVVLLVIFHVFRRGGVSYVFWKKDQLLKEYFEYPQPQDGVLLLGDSLVESTDWAKRFPGITIHNRGKSGFTTDKLLSRINKFSNAKPRKVFVMIGINDLLQCKNLQEITRGHREVVKALKEKFPKAEVYIQSMLPIRIQITENSCGRNESIVQLNDALKMICDQAQMDFINLHGLFLTSENQLNMNYSEDGLHLNAKGYEVWSEAIAGKVLEGFNLPKNTKARAGSAAYD